MPRLLTGAGGAMKGTGCDVLYLDFDGVSAPSTQQELTYKLALFGGAP